MSIYTYEEILPDGTRGQEFEGIQRMTDSPLSHHPQTGRPVRKVITVPNLSILHTAGRQKKLLSNQNLEVKGFTKYEKTGSGHYVRTAGREGPPTLGSP
ncbi:MAG TPA: FmdB family transcriptional regulator [Kiritimatiellia bacterium]|nr:FmdB family transcriptional regulator [Kiritimatiellia bacterium]